MTAEDDRLRDYLRRVTADLRRSRGRLRAIEQERHEPVAIVGVGCRYPGGVGCAEDLWELVAGGTDAVGPFPADRGWGEDLFHPDPDHLGTSYVREGGFLYDATDFDAEFFGVSPREALTMDPQQRLLLEVCWEAAEDAGVDPASLRGSRTGVFAGLMYHDYGSWLRLGDPHEGHLGTGLSGSVATGRVAYVFGLEGPAVTIDTSCSSSLVALHLACLSLRSGESTLALAGGVTVMSTPTAFVEFSRQRGASPDGRCKAYGDRADGVGWSEGVGVLLLERLSDAIRNDRCVLAVIRGSAVNQDGASNGLAAPNGPSQERVIQQALAVARLSSIDVDAVEGHGTGTALGDPIEAQALLATYGRDRPRDRPLWLGSIKSNIGHAQAAAGVAGVIKMVKALEHEALPRTLHADKPSEHVDWSAGAVSLLSAQQPWEQRSGRPRRGGVSSFGVSGTNAHVIVEEAPPRKDAEQDGDSDNAPQGERGAGRDRVPVFARNTATAWVISGRSRDALRGQAERLARFVRASGEIDPIDVGLSSSRRHVFAERAVAVGSDTDELLTALDALHGDAPSAALVDGASGGDGRVAYVFPGQGSQWEGMAVALLDESPLFAAHLRECDDALARYVGWSVQAVLRKEPGAPSLERVDVVQPTLFAVMVSLAELWRACGVRPAAVIGHSQGEVAAACFAGALSLDDAARLIASRSRSLATLAGTGAMLSVGVGEATAESLLRGIDDVVVAAVNGPSSVVLSGEPDKLRALLERWVGEGVRARLIGVDYAAHSPRVESIRDELLAGCEGIDPQSTRIPFYSTVTGAEIDTATLDAEYWYRNLRAPVRFAQAVQSALEDELSAFVEAGPHPQLGLAIQESAERRDAAAGVLVAGSMRRDDGGARRFAAGLAELWVRGVEVDWRRVFEGSGAGGVRLPAYAFQRRRYWLEGDGGGADVSSAGLSGVDHRLLGAVVVLAGGEGGLVFSGRVSLREQEWLSDHAVMGSVLLPGAAFLDLALSAGAYVGCPAVRELTLEAPLVLDDAHGERTLLQVSVGEPDDAGERVVGVYSRRDADLPALPDRSEEEGWTRHAVGTLAAERDGDIGVGDDLESLREAWPPEGATAVDVQQAYERLSGLGLEYGPAFQCLRGVWERDGEVFCEVALEENLSADASAFSLHPALLDAVLQAAVAVAPVGGLAGEPAHGVRLPFSWEQVALGASGASTLRARLRASESVGAGEDGPTSALSLSAVDVSGAPVVSVGRLTTREVSPERLRAAQAEASRHAEDSLFVVEWANGAEFDDQMTVVEPIVIGDADSPLAQALDRAGAAARSFPTPVALAEALASEQGEGDAKVALIDVRSLPVSGESRSTAGRGDSTSPGDGTAPDDPELVPDLPGRVTAAVLELLDLLQRWLADARLSAVEPVFVFAPRQALDPASEAASALADASLRGLLRSARSEHPGAFSVVELDGHAESWRALPGILGGEEPEVALREGRTLVRRLRRPRAKERAGEGWDPEGTVLITGGTGRLGAAVARHLVAEHGVRSLVLASRRGPDADGALELRGELDSMGAHVRVLACDISDRAALAALLDDIGSEPPLRGIVHAAGALDDGVIESLTSDQVERVAAPKIAAGWHLHELTRSMPLSAFVVFSSFAATGGAPAQGNYAAANAFLDELAYHRRALGLPGRSIAWGLWEQRSEMTGKLTDADVARMQRLGFLALSSAEGVELLDRACEVDAPHVVAARTDRAAMRARQREGLLPALFDGLVAVARRRGVRGGSLATRLSGVPEHQREEVVLGLVRAEIAAVLEHSSPGEIDPDRSFKDLGFDSLTAVELRNRLAALTSLRLPATLVFDYPNAGALARHLLGLAEGTKAARARRRTNQRASDGDLVAIVGMSCRFPGGVGGPEDLWRLVAAGGEGVGEFPSDRGWQVDTIYDPDPERVGTTYVRHGGFLYDAPEFDPEFFGISPREALAMDPQQRLLLEVSWEALEDAGIDPAKLRGSDTGVFAGVMHHDYASNLASLPTELHGYIGTGNSGSVVSGRVSYTFGFEGPAVTVDTACSSSLVALHLACLSLGSGECSLALAGGVSVLATPSGFIEFSRLRNLASDGRCKSFSDSADGAGFSEGVGLLLLERLNDARRNGHIPLAVVRGSAVNQDGASNGLSAPNGPSQERVIMQALANAGVSPAQVDAVEAHGTGTTLGDPIEAQALFATYGAERAPGNPLWLGSVKSNIGHTQAAAGVAGVIKMVKALEHRLLPKTLHAASPSTHVDWSVGDVSLLQENRAWEQDGRPRRAGVSSFGVSGTNAHVVLEEAEPIDASGPHKSPGAEEALAFGEGVVAWVFSGKGEDGLRAQADRLSRSLHDRPDVQAADVALSLACRAAFEERAVVVGSDAEQLLSGVAVLSGGGSAAKVVRGSTEARSRAPMFVFGGQGSQWTGMGVELLDQSPVFANRLRECDAALSHFIDWSVEDVLRGVKGAPELDRIEVLQPALFCVMVAMAALWRACGVEPAAVVGHSQGEIAAACVAGGLSLPDAARAIALRSGLLAKLAGRGSIASVAAGVADVQARISAWGGRLSIASVNSPSRVGVVGDVEAIAELLDSLAADGVRAREVASTVSHSSRVEELRADFLELLSAVEPRAADVPFYSTVTGDLFDTAGLTGEYWYRNLREPVQFERAVRASLRDGLTAFVETGPHPILSIAVRETIEDAPSSTGGEEGNRVGSFGDAVVCGSLRREHGGMERFVSSLAQAWVGGVEVDWRDLCAREGAKRVSLPSYAFQRQRYWLRKELGFGGDARSTGGLFVEHGILSAVTRLAHDRGRLYTGHISLDTHPWLADHSVAGTALLPGTGLLDLVLAAGRETGGWAAVHELVLEAPLVIPQEGAVRVQVIVAEPDAEGARAVEVYSQIEYVGRPDQEERIEAPWVRNATGRLLREEDSSEPDGTLSDVGSLDAGSWPPVDAEEIRLGDVYGRLSDVGLEYGRAFQGLRRLWRHGGDIYCEASLEDSELVDAASYEIHPALLDSALHGALVVALEDGSLGMGEVRLPFCWERVGLLAAGASSLLVRVASAEQEAQAGEERERRVSLLAVDRQGRPVASVGALSSRPIAADSLRAAGARPSGPLLGVLWSGADVDAGHGRAAQWALISRRGEASGCSIADAVEPGAVFDDLDELSEGIAAGSLDGVPDVVLLDARCAPEDEMSVGAQCSAAAVAAVLRQWSAREEFATARLLVLTESALHAIDGDEVNGLQGSGVCGVVRSAAAEHPGRFAVVDVDDLTDFSDALRAAAVVSQPQLAIRKGMLLAPRLVQLDGAGATSDSGENPAQSALGPDCSVLITGGTGALGAAVARHLVSRHGVGCVILASRRGLDAPGAQDLRTELEGLGARAIVASCDVSERASLARLLEQAPPEFPLRGVVHAAGAIEDGLIGSLTDASFAATFVPKAHAAWHLHELTQGLELPVFVLFSSIAGVLGSPAQGNYAAANVFLDSLAAYRRARGLSATSIAWGLWEQASELTASLEDADRTRMARGGLLALSTEQALDLFDQACVADVPPLVVAARFDLAALRAAKRAEILPDVLSGLVRDRVSRSQGRGVIARRLADAPEPEREALALELIRVEIAVVLGHDSAEAVDAHTAFKDLGFDSLAAVELRNRLNVATGLTLPATLVFDHPNAQSLAGHILRMLAPAPAQPGALLEAELDRLESTLSRAMPGAGDAAKVAARLRSLLSQLDDGEAPIEHVAVTEMIESASADEVFAFIDGELDVT